MCVTAIVELLTGKLGEWGYDPIRDVTAMRTGELISTFMKKLSDSVRILVILSEKYLRSEYCMAELHEIFRKAGSEKTEFLKRIIPVTMDDARIGSLQDRAAQSMYWQKTVEGLKPLLEFLGVTDFAIYLMMKRWSADIGDMLAMISDLIHPYGWQQITADDFKVVHELVDRRYLDGKQ